MVQNDIRVPEAELARRRAAVSSVRQSSALEGGQGTPAFQALQDEYAAGRISLAELGVRTKALHGIA